VATDQRISTIDTESVASAPVIENEIPTYRAISARAILSVACGVLSACTLAHPFFYVFAIVAIGLGISAQLAIRRFPDMLTGQGLANAGIGLGLVFGLASGTISTVQYVVRSKQAKLFAVQYAEVLKSADKGQMLWYNAHPELRKGKTSNDILEELNARPSERRMAELMGPLAQFNGLHERLSSSKGQDVHFVRLESVGEDEGRGQEMQIYALALFQIDGPASKKFPEERQYVLVVMKARPVGREYEWWTDGVVFPYTPSSYVPKEAPVGDGHDHGGGGHSH
jgi:hypothetical protein